jgi:hypothetical protein
MRCVVALVAAASGCVPTTTYGYQYRLEQQFGQQAAPAEAPNVEARQLLASAKVVAFYPPDVCLNTEAKSTDSLHAGCGTTMSRLERAAEQAGYEVVSWQNLRPPRDSDKRPIDYARDAHVDVLFEMNELDVNTVDDTTVKRTLTFFKDNDGSETPLPVSTDLASNCAAYAAKRDPVKIVGLMGAVDIKTVAVSDGRDRWHYSTTAEKSLGRTYPKVTFVGRSHVHPLPRTLFVLGLVGVTIGATFMIETSALHKEPSAIDPNPTNIDSSPWDLLSVIAGGGFLVGAAVAYPKFKADAPPEKTLCDDKTLVGGQAVVQVGSLSAEHTFTETKVDADAQEVEELRAVMLKDFIATLSEVHGGKR